MHISVQFDDQAEFIAVEVHDVVVDRNLTPELRAVRLAVAKNSPRRPLRPCLISTALNAPDSD
jgi:hypothetical protein